MLRVRVVPQGRLARHSRLRAEGVDVTVPAGCRVRDLVSQVGLFDEEIKRVVVNGRPSRLDKALRRNDLIELHG